MQLTPTVQQVDVVICGSGSAGVCAGAWLARYGIPCKILDKRSGPMEVGQADGVQCRTVEVFDSFGIAEELLRESYHVLEVAFWSSDGQGGIVRTSRTEETKPGLWNYPNVFLIREWVNGLLLECMRRTNGQEVDYNYNVKSVHVDSAEATDPRAFPVTVVTEKKGVEEHFKAKYVLVSMQRLSVAYLLTGIRPAMAHIALCEDH